MKLLQKLLPYLFSIFLFFTSLYVLFYFYEKNLEIKEPQDKLTSSYTVIEERPLGESRYYTHYIRPNTLYQAIKKKGDKIIYDVLYDFNEYSLRVVPEYKPSNKDEHLIFSGCSFTFGEGLNGVETFPTLLENQLEGIRSYNWGLVAGGIHKTLHHHDFFPLKSYVKEQQGRLIYVFITDHLNRFLATPDFLDWAATSDPYYAVEDDKVIYKGPLEEQPFFKRYRMITERSGLKSINLKLHSLFKNKDHFEINELKHFVLAIKNLKEEYLEQFPQGEFIFIFHPLSSPLNQKKELKEILSKRNITYLDPTDEFYQYVDELDVKHDEFRIPNDGHPNKKFNDYFSRYITEKILKRGREI